MDNPVKAIGTNGTVAAAVAAGDLYCNYGDCGTSGDCEGNFCACFFFSCGCADGSPGNICGRSDAAEDKGEKNPVTSSRPTKICIVVIHSKEDLWCIQCHVNPMSL